MECYFIGGFAESTPEGGLLAMGNRMVHSEFLYREHNFLHKNIVHCSHPNISEMNNDG